MRDSRASDNLATMWNFVLGLLLASTLAAEPEPTARYEWYSDDGTPRWSASIEPPPAADETDPRHNA